MVQERILWYFADPMCSWCWGFTPAISAIKASYSDRVKIALMLGGLRPGTTEPVTPKFREETLRHWQDVHKMTGQPFAFEGAMPEGFVYDTEPASRAVIAVAGINLEATFPYFKSVQKAFYTQGQDVTRAETLAELAEQHNIDKPRFLERFESEDVKNKTRTHFRVTREAGVRGFPTIVLQARSGQKLLTNGCRPLEELRPELEAWLTETA
ncbi:MAG: DsbA family protein [Sulfuricaulis sp.]|uniref:DsbA family protein n=1 Tax=Sulfuricaulis sp. TaxID=2003553 RepID=UPI003C36A8CF